MECSDNLDILDDSICIFDEYIIIEPLHDKSNELGVVSSNKSDQPRQILSESLLSIII